MRGNCSLSMFSKSMDVSRDEQVKGILLFITMTFFFKLYANKQVHVYSNSNFRHLKFLFLNCNLYKVLTLYTYTCNIKTKVSYFAFDNKKSCKAIFLLALSKMDQTYKAYWHNTGIHQYFRAIVINFQLTWNHSSCQGCLGRWQRIRLCQQHILARQISPTILVASSPSGKKLDDSIQNHRHWRLLSLLKIKIHLCVYTGNHLHNK